jgi:hypothetical protein
MLLEYWDEGIVVKIHSAIAPNDPAVFELERGSLGRVAEGIRVAYPETGK